MDSTETGSAMPVWIDSGVTCPFLQGPGEVMVQFCMASLLATLVLDDEVMELIKWVAR